MDVNTSNLNLSVLQIRLLLLVVAQLGTILILYTHTVRLQLHYLYFVRLPFAPSPDLFVSLGLPVCIRRHLSYSSPVVRFVGGS